ncbi:hypothetical protein P879_02196 [Paragonimus westermani]|uniref:DIX domain-containing protein n=1 Tax=Paragonimus westermani TaxID=34504 RepID=A0A8T0DUW8_9TREM|nr:hypothetical protein P879_02196 [Paragonimus westermani]
MTSRFAVGRSRFLDRYSHVDIQPLHDFLHLCSQYDEAHVSGDYELVDRIVQKILEIYLLPEIGNTSNNVLLSASGISPCSSADTAKNQALRFVINTTTLGRVMECIQGLDSVTKVNGKHNGCATSNREHLPQDLFDDMRGEVEDYISSRIHLETMRTPHLNGCSDGVEHDRPSTANSCITNSSLPLTTKSSDHQVFPDSRLSPLAPTTAPLMPEDKRDTKTNLDVRLAVQTERGLHIQSHRSDRVLDETPIDTIPDETDNITAYADLEANITMDSADSSSPSERSKKLHTALAQFAWARTFFNHVSRQYILNPVRPDSILEEHLARVWHDRARSMMQEDERDGLPTVHRPKRRTERIRVYSRRHLRNNVNQIAAGSRQNGPDKLIHSFGTDEIATSSKLQTQMKRSLSSAEILIESELHNRIHPFNRRYFFKCASDEFAPGVVYQECTLNSQPVPLWRGQVWAKIEIDD